jgi:hypothetical protein
VGGVDHDDPAVQHHADLRNELSQAWPRIVRPGTVRPTTVSSSMDPRVPRDELRVRP